MNPKLILPISLSLNLALAAFGAVVLSNGRARSAAEQVAAKTNPAIPLVKQKELPAATVPEVRSLRWSDLASSDDAIFAQNLRATGCPESTIRDILTAAIGHRYDQQRQALQIEHQQGKIDTATMEAALAHTWDQQNAQVNQLPASVTPSSQAAPATISQASTSGAAYQGSPVAASAGGVAGGSSAVRSSFAPAVTPVALTEPPASLGLTDDQKAAAYQVGDNFSSAIAAKNLPPTAPGYHQAWQDSQPSADDALKAQIGYQAFVRWQIQAAVQGSAPQPSK
jgi:hypothetical protein